MCICILKPNNKEISEEVLKKAYDNNPDGLGIMFTFESQIRFFKGCYSYKEFLGFYNRKIVKQADSVVLHFRTASSAGVGYDYCHPHFVNDNLAFVHNGNFFEFSSWFKGREKDDQIDTQRFNKEVLQRLPKDFIWRKDIIEALENYCQNSMSKMIFMDNTGFCTIINSSAGVWENGCWFSNGGMDNYTGYGFSGAYKYKEGDVRHKGGLPTRQVFSHKKAQNWKQCKKCGGNFHKDEIKYNKCPSCTTCDKLLSFCKG